MTDFLDDRYGRTQRRPWIFPAAAAGLIIVAILWSIWAALDHIDEPVSARVFGYSVLSDNEIEVTIDVQRENGAAATCTIAAKGRDHSVVGERSIVIPASGESRERVSTIVETQRRAVTAALDGCALTP